MRLAQIEFEFAWYSHIESKDVKGEAIFILLFPVIAKGFIR